jgi:hypothetical protein
VTRIGEHRDALHETGDRTAHLLEHSGLPGPRGNLELAQAAADVCTLAELRRWARLGPEEAPTGTPEEFLSFCGVLRLARELRGAALLTTPRQLGRL